MTTKFSKEQIRKKLVEIHSLKRSPKRGRIIDEAKIKLQKNEPNAKGIASVLLNWKNIEPPKNREAAIEGIVLAIHTLLLDHSFDN